LISLSLLACCFMIFEFFINQKMFATIATIVWNIHNISARHSHWRFHRHQKDLLDYIILRQKKFISHIKRWDKFWATQYCSYPEITPSKFIRIIKLKINQNRTMAYSWRIIRVRVIIFFGPISICRNAKIMWLVKNPPINSWKQ